MKYVDSGRAQNLADMDVLFSQFQQAAQARKSDSSAAVEKLRILAEFGKMVGYGHLAPADIIRGVEVFDRLTFGENGGTEPVQPSIKGTVAGALNELVDNLVISQREWPEFLLKPVLEA